jgi:hypothetical protein
LKKAEKFDETWCVDVCGYLSFPSKRSTSRKEDETAQAYLADQLIVKREPPGLHRQAVVHLDNLLGAR